MASTDNSSLDQTLSRDVGMLGAVVIGLGSIIGTGIFVSIAIAAGSAGPSVVLAIAVAAVVATFNGLSSAQLAAHIPRSGGTYEYGYRLLHPAMGFTAGWMFLCAKSASAATAALGFAGYTLYLAGAASDWARWLLVPLALSAIVLLTLLVLSGMRRTSGVNIAVVSVSLLSLAAFVVLLSPVAVQRGGEHLVPFFHPVDEGAGALAGFLQACALMFVAYTGYGRIATLGEEIRDPRRSIPRAVILTLAISMVLYVSVGLVAVAAVGPQMLTEAAAERAAPLVVVARQGGAPLLGVVVAAGAVTAMAGVLLNLILGLSRVLLAMGRRGDMPALFGRLSGKAKIPVAAILGVAAAIAGLSLIGDVRTTWSFSAFTVLVYYAITNLAATRLNADQRLFHPAIPWAGFACCLGLAFWIQPAIWIVGIVLIAAGLLWHRIASRWMAKP